MNMKEPLQFSVFPSLLLLLTLFRLGLNISTTRAILTHGDAGGVVETFGIICRRWKYNCWFSCISYFGYY